MLLISVCYSSKSQAIQNTDPLQTSDTIFLPELDTYSHVVDQIMPKFPGGEDSLIAFVKDHITYPESLIKDSIKGDVIIRFYIDEMGFADSVGFIRTLHPELEKECVEMVSDLPRFIPGSILKRSNKGLYWGSTKFWYMIPVYFSPTNKYPGNKRIVIMP
jgi:hypothetical protein